jgi:hypothetical protein
MTSRSRSRSVIFNRPFELKGIGHTLPAGEYEVVTDEELVEDLSFPVYHRVATTMFLPKYAGGSSGEMVTIDPADLQAAGDRDSSAARQ